MKPSFIASASVSCAVLLLSLSGCGDDEESPYGDRDFREDMRDFVIGIAEYARQTDPDFVVIPQNGHDLMTLDGEPGGEVASDYVGAISGAGQEDLVYGYDEDNAATPADERERLEGLLDVAEANGVEALVTDYCWDEALMDDSYAQNEGKGYISFAADDRDLRTIPDYPAEPHDVNADDVASLADARNFLYLLDPSEFGSKDAFLGALQATNYDAIIMDYFYEDTQALSADDVASLKTKADGGSRLVISYMSIGEAEDYRYYWQEEWDSDPPSWLDEENEEWEGNYKVRYWEADWQAIIYGSPDAYLDRIIASGFDGVYLDIIEAFEHFE